jgi:hypothetical protein
VRRAGHFQGLPLSKPEGCGTAPAPCRMAKTPSRVRPCPRKEAESPPSKVHPSDGLLRWWPVQSPPSVPSPGASAGTLGAARHRSRGRSDPPPPDRPASAVAMPLRRSGYGSRAAPRRHAPAGTRTAEAEPPGRGAKERRPRSSHEGGGVCGDLAAGGASPTTSTRGPQGPADPERRSRLLEPRFLHSVPDAERSHDVAAVLPALQNQRTIGRQDPATRSSTKRPPPRSTS